MFYIFGIAGTHDVQRTDIENSTVNIHYLDGVGYPAYVQRISITQTGIEKSFHSPLILFTSKYTGSVFILRSLHLENCDASYSTESGNILASCEFPSTSMASGFQMILQFNDPANVESVQRVRHLIATLQSPSV